MPKNSRSYNRNPVTSPLSHNDKKGSLLSGKDKQEAPHVKLDCDDNNWCDDCQCLHSCDLFLPSTQWVKITDVNDTGSDIGLQVERCNVTRDDPDYWSRLRVPVEGTDIKSNLFSCIIFRVNAEYVSSTHKRLLVAISPVFTPMSLQDVVRRDQIAIVVQSVLRIKFPLPSEDEYSVPHDIFMMLDKCAKCGSSDPVFLFGTSPFCNVICFVTSPLFEVEEWKKMSAAVGTDKKPHASQSRHRPYESTDKSLFDDDIMLLSYIKPVFGVGKGVEDRRGMNSVTVARQITSIWYAIFDIAKNWDTHPLRSVSINRECDTIDIGFSRKGAKTLLKMEGSYQLRRTRQSVAMNNNGNGLHRCSTCLKPLHKKSKYLCPTCGAGYCNRDTCYERGKLVHLCFTQEGRRMQVLLGPADGSECNERAFI